MRFNTEIVVPFARVFSVGYVGSREMIEVGVPSRRRFFRTLRLCLGRSRGAQGPESTFGDAFVGVPHVIARRVNVIQAQRRDMRDQAFVDLVLSQRFAE
jgi:hypothetical protein